ncbi:hypothetical protein ACA910_000359 [Epithemia clementina (nom. ined.)]
MAGKRGRKPKKEGNTKKAQKEESKAKQQEEKAMTMENGEEDEGSGDQEEWEFVRLLTSESPDTCRTDGCSTNAVAIWTSQSNPDDEWPVCFGCQVKEFGGYPEGVTPSDHDDGECKEPDGNGNLDSHHESPSDQKSEDENKDTNDEGAVETTPSPRKENEPFDNDESSKTSPSLCEDEKGNTTAECSSTTPPTPKEHGDNQGEGNNEDSTKGTPSLDSENEDDEKETEDKGSPNTSSCPSEKEKKPTKNETHEECSELLLSASNKEENEVEKATESDDSGTSKTPLSLEKSQEDGPEIPIQKSSASMLVLENELGNERQHRVSQEADPDIASNSNDQGECDGIGPHDGENVVEEDTSADEAALGSTADKDDQSEIGHKGRNEVESKETDAGDEQGSVQSKCDEDPANEDEVDEQWDVKKIMSIKDLTDFPVICSAEGCVNVAALVYISNLAPTENWYSCLDCQEDDFGGWPDIAELPIFFMTEEHMALMRTKCSKRKNIAMPCIKEQPPLTSPSANPTTSHTITPVPQQGLSGAKAAVISNAKTTRDVTPLEPKPKEKPAAKPSKEALAMHRKWQEQAEALGGKDARIVVSKPEAKKLIFDLLHDAFQPMNITQIHKELKAIVPSPVLKTCLDDMALDSSSGTVFADSDDEEENKGASLPLKDTAPYSGSICFKGGKTSNTMLYYVDYKQLKNNGNGLDCEEKSKLFSDLAQAQQEKEFFQNSIQAAKASTAKLLSEPTNEEATAKLATEEASFSLLLSEVEAARELKVNEKTKHQLKRRIEHMTNQWRKRRRMCIEFLNSMEDCTEGTISAKKCLSGDGQIEIDSDEAVIKAAAAFAKSKKKKARPMLSRATNNLGPSPTASFIGVKLDSQKGLVRVLVDDDDH